MTDSSGNVTTVARDPRFDEDERELWIARWEYEQTLCPECGNPRSVCSDPNVDNYPQTATCYVAAARQVAGRRLNRASEKRGPDKNDYRLEDGTWVWISPVDTGASFLSAGLPESRNNPTQPNQQDDDAKTGNQLPGARLA